MKNCEYLGKGISSPLMLGGRCTPRQWSCSFQKPFSTLNYKASNLLGCFVFVSKNIFLVFVMSFMFVWLSFCMLEGLCKHYCFDLPEKKSEYVLFIISRPACWREIIICTMCVCTCVRECVTQLSLKLLQLHIFGKLLVVMNFYALQYFLGLVNFGLLLSE